MQKSGLSRENTDSSVRMEDEQGNTFPEKRCENRRRKRCDGYVHLPAVGWYCRRLKTRRETDIYTSNMI